MKSSTCSTLRILAGALVPGVVVLHRQQVLVLVALALELLRQLLGLDLADVGAQVLAGVEAQLERLAVLSWSVRKTPCDPVVGADVREDLDVEVAGLHQAAQALEVGSASCRVLAVEEVTLHHADEAAGGDGRVGRAQLLHRPS
jgi:hypothetical protein